jgi:hypothetical protein
MAAEVGTRDTEISTPRIMVMGEVEEVEGEVEGAEAEATQEIPIRTVTRQS